MTFSDNLERSVIAMSKIGRCWSPSFSLDGRYLAFISDLNGIPQAWLVSTKGGWPELVTNMDDEIYKVSWSPDGSRLAFILTPGGGMNSQIYVVHPDGSGLRRLTDGGEENNWLGVWTWDGKGLFISSNRTNPQVIAPYLVNVANGEFQQITGCSGVSVVRDVSRDGRLALLYQVVDRGDSNLYLVDLISSKVILLTPHTGRGNFRGGRFSSDGRVVYISSDQDREFTVFAYLTLDADGTPGPLKILAARENAELQTFVVTEDGSTAALVWNEAGHNQLGLFNLVTQQETPIPDLPFEIIYELAVSRNGRYLAISGSGASTPTDIWILDRHSNGKSLSLHQVTHSPHAGVNLEAIVNPQLVHFLAHDGLRLSGWLYRPKDFTTGPVVLSFHGGPEAQERPEFNSLYQALLAQGIAVMAPNVRGSSGFGKTFAGLDDGIRRFNAVRDIKSCVDYVIQTGVANPSKIGIMGESYGGYMVMAGLTEYHEYFAAGVNISGIVNFKTFFANTEPWMASVSKTEYGDPETEMEMLYQLSPIHKIDRIEAPVLIMHGANDTNVPVIEAEQLVSRLRESGILVNYILFPDEGHSLGKRVNRTRSTVEITKWFIKYLISAD